MLEIGDEAFVDARSFSLRGRSMRNVRQAVKRVKRAGYTASVRRQREVPAAELAQMARVADAWRGGSTERGFSMALGRFGDPADSECVVVTAHLDGAMRALLNFVPWGADGLSLDLMRRDRTADNGLNEFLIAELLAACPELGVARVSLNFALFRAALARGEKLGAGPVSRWWSRLLVFASRWWQIESLYRFNAKFAPEWVPRYICYPAPWSLGRIAMAAMEAEAFWRRPDPFQLLARRRPLGSGRPAVESARGATVPIVVSGVGGVRGNEGPAARLAEGPATDGCGPPPALTDEAATSDGGASPAPADEPALKSGGASPAPTGEPATEGSNGPTAGRSSG